MVTQYVETRHHAMLVFIWKLWKYIHLVLLRARDKYKKVLDQIRAGIKKQNLPRYKYQMAISCEYVFHKTDEIFLSSRAIIILLERSLFHCTQNWDSALIKFLDLPTLLSCQRSVYIGQSGRIFLKQLLKTRSVRVKRSEVYLSVSVNVIRLYRMALTRNVDKGGEG